MSEGPKPNTARVTVTDIKEAVASGLPVTCATCNYYHEARLKGLPGCGKMACGGPIIGRDFPDYKGQITKEKLNSICLICGDGLITHRIIIPGKEQQFALCNTHKNSFNGVILDPSIDLTQIPLTILPL